MSRSTIQPAGPGNTRRRRIWQGAAEAANTLRELLPEYTRAKIISLVALPANADLREIQERTLAVALAEKHNREAALATSVLDRAAAGTGVVVGKSATLDALIRDQVLTLVVDRDLKANLWRCTRYGHLSGKEIESCPIRHLALGQTNLQYAVMQSRLDLGEQKKLYRVSAR